MSCSPHAFGRNFPTGAVNAYPSEPLIPQSLPVAVRKSLSAPLAYFHRSSSSSPKEKRVFVPARHAYSHSASLGRRQVFPPFFESQSQNATASFQLTFTTGCSSV